MSKYLLVFLIWFSMAGSAAAETLLMARSYETIDVVLEKANKILEGHGYTVAHEQRCDGGLKGFGYATDTYRVLFFGKPEEVRHLSKTYPELVPYLPLKMAIYAEGDEVLVISFNPEEYGVLFPRDEKLQTQFSRWKSDIDSILAAIRQGPGTNPK